MIRDLNRVLKERMEGGEPDFEAFQQQYPELAGGAKDWDELLRADRAGHVRDAVALESMSPEMREQLEGMLGAALQRSGPAVGDERPGRDALGAHADGRLRPLRSAATTR